MFGNVTGIGVTGPGVVPWVTVGPVVTTAGSAEEVEIGRKLGGRNPLGNKVVPPWIVNTSLF